jgi:hypothetical protein
MNKECNYKVKVNKGIAWKANRTAVIQMIVQRYMVWEPFPYTTVYSTTLKMSKAKHSP